MRRKILASYFIVILIMLCRFVPFKLMNVITNKSTGVQHLTYMKQKGYYSLWYHFEEYEAKAVVDYKLLIGQTVIITIIFVIIYLLLPIKKIKNIKALE